MWNKHPGAGKVSTANLYKLLNHEPNLYLIMSCFDAAPLLLKVSLFSAELWLVWRIFQPKPYNFLVKLLHFKLPHLPSLQIFFFPGSVFGLWKFPGERVSRAHQQPKLLQCQISCCTIRQLPAFIFLMSIFKLEKTPVTLLSNGDNLVDVSLWVWGRDFFFFF